MTPADYWHEILDGHPDAARLGAVLTLLAAIEIDEVDIRAAADRISHLEGVGPILDPSAWTDGRRFDHAREVRRVLLALADLIAVLPDPPGAT